MGQYRHVGTYTQIFDTPYTFTKFGQLVEVPDDVAAKVPSLIPAEEFDALGFDATELGKFANVSTHSQAPAEFIQKRNAAWLLMEEKRIALTGAGEKVHG